MCWIRSKNEDVNIEPPAGSSSSMFSYVLCDVESWAVWGGAQSKSRNSECK